MRRLRAALRDRMEGRPFVLHSPLPIDEAGDRLAVVPGMHYQKDLGWRRITGRVSGDKVRLRVRRIRNNRATAPILRAKLVEQPDETCTLIGTLSSPWGSQLFTAGWITIALYGFGFAGLAAVVYGEPLVGLTIAAMSLLVAVIGLAEVAVVARRVEADERFLHNALARKLRSR
jgi:hypothetical protein